VAASPIRKASQLLIPGNIMEIPLQVAKDKVGIFRDALNRSMIMVFNSTKKHAKDSKKAGSKSDVNANHTESPLMFVQVNRSKKEARLERTLCRTILGKSRRRRRSHYRNAPTTSSTPRSLSKLAWLRVMATLRYVHFGSNQPQAGIHSLAIRLRWILALIFWPITVRGLIPCSSYIY
jgi:hypothetical protein